MDRVKPLHKLLFILSFVLLATSWIVAIYYWDKLPNVIPTHFGPNGMPDVWNEKSIFYVFLLPFIQTIMFLVFIFLYYKPQYSNMPTTLWLTTLDEKKKDHAFNLIRTMHTIILTWVNIFFAYIVLEMNRSSLNNTGLNPWIMIFMVAIMLSYLIYWNIIIYKKTIKEIKNDCKN
ncbi:DUF1648 domain-containing protein [bacterium]|nr:DUF1648 domain-containing protein [bacterium]